MKPHKLIRFATQIEKLGVGDLLIGKVIQDTGIRNVLFCYKIEIVVDDVYDWKTYLGRRKMTPKLLHKKGDKRYFFKWIAGNPHDQMMSGEDILNFLNNGFVIQYKKK